MSTKPETEPIRHSEAPASQRLDLSEQNRQDLSRSVWDSYSDKPAIARAMPHNNDNANSASALYQNDGKMVLPGIMLVGGDSERGAGQSRGAESVTGQKPEKASQEENLKARVLDNNLSSEERLKAVKELVNLGTTNLSAKDEQGKESKLRLEVEKAGNRDMVHLFVNDGKGEKTALRGIMDGAQVEKQIGQGKQVSLEGRGFHTLKGLSDSNKTAASKSGEPEVAKRPEPEVAKRPEPEVTKRPEPEVSKRPEPEVTKRPEPEVSKRPEPEVAKRPEPEVAKRPEPEVAKRPEPEVAKRPEPEVAKRPEPEVAKRPEPDKKTEKDQQPEPMSLEEFERQENARKSVAEKNERSTKLSTEGDTKEVKPENKSEAKPKTEILNPLDKEKVDTEKETKGEDGDKPRQSRIVRTLSDRSRFYTHQDDSKSCSAFSFGMMASDHLYGRPVKHGSEAQYFKELAGTINHGYRGDLKSVEAKLQQIGLDAKAYEYGFGKVSRESLRDLNRELDQGKSAVVKVINPTTKNPHYIYVAGRDKNGDYIVGDPARSNRTNSAPVSPDFLYSMMRQRDGFVVGGAPKDSAGRVFNVPSTDMSQRRRRN